MAPAQDQRSTDASLQDPQSEYLRLRAERETTLAGLRRRDLSISRARTATVAAAAALAWPAFGMHLFSGWWLLAPLALFVALASVHDRVLTARRRAERAVAFYDSGLRRLESRWMGRGVTATDFVTAAHPYAVDLDLFGRGSLFDLICQARTRGGQEVLAQWLLQPANATTVRERQAAIAELRPRVNFREDIALLGDETTVDVTKLQEWGAVASQLDAAWIRPLALSLACFGISAALAWWRFQTGPWPLLAVVAAGIIFEWRLRPRLKRTLDGADGSVEALGAVSGLLARLERETFVCPLLRRLRTDLDTASGTPSEEILRLSRMLEWLKLRESLYFVPIARLLLWTVQFAVSIDKWRGANGSRLSVWLRVAAEFEALSSLAGYAYERPNDPFPQIADGGAILAAADIAHPLLPAQSAVANSVDMSAEKQLYVVSGSNMSGKSTLLRTVGVNAVLALCGAPVRAGSMVISPLQIGASLRTQDSLQGGVSRFYAEVLRLKQVVNLTESGPPTLFLLDEILHGTNSHDRLIGAEAIARSLVRHGAIGFITTHDLALARIVGDPELRAENVHFEDQLVDGKMSFDYRLRNGVVEKSNALELMRAAGLDV